jgi:hypothetical protein
MSMPSDLTEYETRLYYLAMSCPIPKCDNVPLGTGMLGWLVGWLVGCSCFKGYR